MLRAVKSEVPVLLGFQACNIYIAGDQRLYSVSIDAEAEKILESGKRSFEQDYVIDESQVVKFPQSMGINGFAYQNDSINYLNNC